MENMELSDFDLLVTQAAITIISTGDLTALDDPKVVPDERTRLLVLAYVADAVLPYLCKKNLNMIVKA